MLVTKKKYEALLAEKEALGERLVWMEVLLAEHEKFSASQRLLGKLDRLNQKYDKELKRAPKHSDSSSVDVNAWAREMKAANPGNPFSWTD